MSTPRAERLMADMAEYLKVRDFQAVAALLRMLAAEDPYSAQMILDTIDLTTAGAL